MLFSAMIISCGDEGNNDPRSVVDSFATAYFNWRFKEAEPCVTNESREWLRFAASQVDSEDVDSLRDMEYAATVEVEDIDDIDDSTALATVTVKDFLALDSIGKHPRRQAERKYQIPIALEGDYWRVRLKRLP